MFYKINNFINSSGQCDYKGLNKKQIIPGSQFHPNDLQKNNYYILGSTEDVMHEDLIKLTEEEYNTLKQQIISSYPPTPESEQAKKIAELEAALLETTTLNAIQQAQNEQAILELTMMIGGM